MFYIYKLAGTFVTPLCFLILLLLFTSFCLIKKPRRLVISFTWIFVSVLLYFMSTAFGSRLLLGSIEEAYSPILPDDLSHAAILVLGGGMTYDNDGKPVRPGIYALERVVCAVGLAKSTDLPIVMSGGDVYGTNGVSEASVMKHTAEQLGCSGSVITEDESRTTKENIINTAKLLKNSGNGHDLYGVDKIILVTSAFHMPRAVTLAKKHLTGVKIYPYPSGRRTDPVYRGFQDYLPNSSNFDDSCLGVRELVGRIYASIL